ncbi:hypothetical protein G7Z17_g2442 [Cylindrodendrum hubeiense]|uniref:FAD-binding domain-containing protein n=1 Tax=Cylindrodendrum hubeiense TaxID=595255 RepID=A0A9P5LL10_9HYPO|nr:hypothetical protein G7Z17_g2442 [Cylindrodendrum hubeiense]
MAVDEGLTTHIKVAIIGGGPAGLSAAIQLAKIPFIDWKLYEQKPTISEISTGITLQRNTWALLEKMGASKNLRAKDFFRPTDGHDNQYRNTKTVFEDGFTDAVDLLVGADGIRSITRSFAFPDHTVSYSGLTAYRALVRSSDAEQINGLAKAAIFWYGIGGDWVYTCPLNETDWEITGRFREPDVSDRSSWGRDVDVAVFAAHFAGYCEPLQQLLSLVTSVKRYDYFGSSRLETVVNEGNTVLIGDASHPLSGAFGAGAAFALEDANTLAGALRWAGDRSCRLKDALRLFNEVRSAHYKALYQTLDDVAARRQRISTEKLSEEKHIVAQVENVSQERHTWMYYHDTDVALEEAIELLERFLGTPRISLRVNYYID